jgi:hypothetical protein
VANGRGWQPDEGVRPLGGITFFLAPLLALFHLRLTPEREGGVRGNWMCLRPNADAPTSLSSLLLLRLHGSKESPDEVDLPRSRGRREDDEH